MANLIIHIPSCRWALVSLFVLLVLGGFAASATFTALAFIEIRQLDFARSQSMSRLRDLEGRTLPDSYVSPHTPAHCHTPQDTNTADRHTPAHCHTH